MTAAFLERAPKIEDKGAVFVITPEDGTAWAMTRHEFARFLEAGRRAVLEGDRHGSEAVIPLCELCVRFDLPRLDGPRAATAKRES